MADNVIHIHSFCFNKRDNGGESLTLTTKFYGNGDPPTQAEGVFTNQSIVLQSYCNSASIDLCGVSLTPQILRQFADELEIARNEVVRKLKLEIESTKQLARG